MIDHIIYADPDLDRAVAEFARTYGIAPAAGGRHVGYGTRNALAGLTGGRYLELMAVDPEQDVPPSRRFFGLDATFEPRFVAWCAHAARPLEETVEIARSAGFDLGEIVSMSRARPDGTLLSWRLTSPFAARAGNVLPFYIDWGDAPNPALSMPPSLSLSLQVIHPDAARIQHILDALGKTEVACIQGASPALRVRLT